MLSVLVVPDQGVYEFEYSGPDSHETGTFPLGDEKSIARLVEMTKDISAMNVAASGNKPYSGVSDGLDVLAKLRQEIVEFTDDGPPRPTSAATWTSTDSTSCAVTSIGLTAMAWSMRSSSSSRART